MQCSTLQPGLFAGHSEVQFSGDRGPPDEFLSGNPRQRARGLPIQPALDSTHHGACSVRSAGDRTKGERCHYADTDVDTQFHQIIGRSANRPGHRRVRW